MITSSSSNISFVFWLLRSRHRFLRATKFRPLCATTSVIDAVKSIARFAAFDNSLTDWEDTDFDWGLSEWDWVWGDADWKDTVSDGSDWGTPTDGLSTEGSQTEGSPTLPACGIAFGSSAVTRGLFVCWG